MAGRVIAIVGTRNVFARHLLRRLPEWAGVDKVIAFDVAPLSQRPSEALSSPHVRTIQLDLTLTSSDAQMASVLDEEGVDTLLHLAFLEQPVRDELWAHELESIGTMHILNACAAAQIPRLIVRSSTVVYGLDPRHPQFLRESAALTTSKKIRFVRDKVDAEKQIAEFCAWNEHTVTTVLRFCPIVGPHSRDFVIPYLSELVKLRLFGRDPLLQLLHEDDALAAMELAIEQPVAGTFNIAPDGVLPLQAVLQATHSRSVGLPLPLARGVVRLLWALDFRQFPPSFLDFLRFLCLADNQKAREQLGFQPRYTTREALHLYRQTEAFASSMTLFR